MALATKFQIVGTSDIYGKVTVNIQLDGYAGAIIPLEGVGRNWIELKIGDNSNDISNPILAGKLTFSFYVLEDFETTEIGRSQANTYYVEVLDNLNDQIWAGWALPEEYKEAYHNTPYVATVVASDGLDELKSRPYVIEVGKVVLMNHIVNCLNLTQLSLPIFESINIYSNGMVSTNADSPLKQAQIQYNSFLNISETPDSYAVLGSILQPFFARIYQYRGWRIENISQKKTSYVVREYSSSGVYVGNSTFDPLVKFDTDYNDFRAFIEKSGQLSIKPALNNADVYFNTVEPAIESSTGGFQLPGDWDSATELKNWTPVGSSITIDQQIAAFDGNIFAVRIPGRKTSWSADDYLESDPVTLATVDYESINVDFSYWVNYPSIIILGERPIAYFEVLFTETGTGTQWNWANNTWELIPFGFPKKLNRIETSQRQRWRPYSMVIDRVPANGTLVFRFYKLIKSGSEGVTSLRLTGWKTNLIAQQPTNATLLRETGQTTTVTTYKGPSFAHIVSDGLIVNGAGVMDVANVLTATWSRRGVTESLNIRRLFLLQWLTLNSKPTEILSGTIHQKGEVITPMSVIKDKDGVSSVRYVMTSYSFSLGTGIGSGNYRELVTADAVLQYFEIYLDKIADGDFFPSGFNPLFIPGAPGTSPGIAPIPTIPNFDLNGDVRGAFGQTEITPASIQNKARLDITSLNDDEIVFGAVKDDPSQENMTNLRLSDIKSRIGTIPTAAVIGRYDIDTSGTTAPVGTKDIRYNNATQISATQLFISDITEDNIDVDLFLSLIKQSSALVIQDRGDHLNYQTYEVSGTPTFASATWTFPVTFKDSGGTGTTGFANNHKVLLSALSSGSGSDPNKVSYNVSDSKNATERNQARVNIGSTSATPQVIATAGAINDLTVTSNSLVFTGASVVLSGIVAGLDGEEIAILNASGTNLTLLSQDALSSANNRFASGVIVPNLSILRIKYRTTTNRWFFENVGVNDGRYLRKDVADTKLDNTLFIPGTGNSNFFRIRAKDGVSTAYEYVGVGGGLGAHRWDGRRDDTPYIFNVNGVTELTTYREVPPWGGVNRSTWSFQARINVEGNSYIHARAQAGFVNNTIIYAVNSVGTVVAQHFYDGTIFHARSSQSDRSTRRDELYLNYSQTVATAGTINDLAINADCKLLILTGATDLTGVIPVDNTRLLRIEASGANRIIRHESASSTAANRFSIGADLTINAGEVYQFIYTSSRWRRVL